jgi:hypothetical protein
MLIVIQLESHLIYYRNPVRYINETCNNSADEVKSVATEVKECSRIWLRNRVTGDIKGTK